MLSRLEPDQFEQTQPLFAPLGHHLALRAALHGAVPARLYADRAEQPTAALAWVQRRLFLAGPNAANALRAVLEADIAPRLRAAGEHHLALYPAPSASAAGVEEQLHWLEERPHTAVRHYYEADLTQPLRHAPLPAGFNMRPVDAALLANSGLGHLDLLQAEMTSERPSVAAFLEHSFGVCAIQAGALAGWCLSEYNHAGACEVGIETLPDHRGQGVARALTLALLEAARRAGLVRVGWHCYATNAASVATARSAGFTFVTEYPALVLTVG